MSTPSTSSLPWSQREPAAWLMRVGGWLQWLLLFAGIVALFVGSFGLSQAVWEARWPGIFLAIAAHFIAVAMHELGHFAGARAGGMHVLRAHVSWLDFRAVRQGWRLRWAAPAWRVDGAVMAMPCSARSLRQQEVWFVLGGPLANLLAGAISAVAAWAAWRSGPGWFFVGFAAYSVALGLANLVPQNKPMPSDGLLLWRLAKGKDETDPMSTLQIINGLCIEGTTADKIPPALLDRLRQQEPQPAMVLLWFECFAGLQRAEWQAMASLGPRIYAALAEVPEAEKPGYAGLAAVLRTFVDLAEALHTGQREAPLDRHLPPMFDWESPSLRPACRALEAALAGNRAGCESWLAQAGAEADQSVDAAFRATHGVLREAIRARLADGRPAPSLEATA